MLGRKESFDEQSQLQSQVFEINRNVLDFIKVNRNRLEEVGLLVDRRLSKLNIQKASDKLRSLYFNDEVVKKEISINILLNDLLKRLQQARYEDFILTLACSYKDYKFYLPAFVDFRGRIYRAGVLHFHERDLSKCLLLFSNYKDPQLDKKELLSKRAHLACAAAYKYKKFDTYLKSYNWYIKNHNKMKKNPLDISDNMLIELARKASDPFQFIAKYLSNDRVTDENRIVGLNKVPLSQDAAASAYQIMSYLLLNIEIGKLTNLIPSQEDEVKDEDFDSDEYLIDDEYDLLSEDEKSQLKYKLKDLYLSLKEELLKFLKSRLEPNKYSIIQSGLTRKVVKQIFMPLIYGKTVHAMSTDISEVYGSMLSKKDHYKMAALCNEFFIHKCPDIANLMNLLNLIGWLCAYKGTSVYYGTPYITTVQDYMRSKKAEISIYDRVSYKRRRVTLRVPTLDRDKRKTKVSTCVNFIHQKDAYIAMKVVEKLTSVTNGDAPIYTVHDNFITSAVYAKHVPFIYTNVFIEMGHPLCIINDYIRINILKLGHYCKVKDQFNIANHNLNEPIPRSLLEEDLLKFETIDPTYLKKVDETLVCYEEYVNTVCGEDRMSHAHKWDVYKSHLDKWVTLNCNYSLHY